jgi:choline kinase
MKIIKTKSPVKELARGREPKYPFKELSPGNTLVIEVQTNEDINRIKSAFYQWKKYNNPDYKSRTQLSGSKILIHAI